MTYSNAKQSIPEVFREKMKIDKSIQTLCELSSDPESMNSHKRWNAFKELWKLYKETQNALRQGCENFIERSKKES